MLVRLTTGVAIALALIAGGCKRKSGGDPTKVTVESKDNATKPIVDDNYRFKLAWPGTGWKLMHERDASRIVPDAVAGAVHGNTVFGVVIVEAAPGVPLDGYADLLIDKMPLEGKVTEKRERVKYAGTDAVRFVVSGAIEGVQFRYVEYALLHQGYGYQLLGWGTTSDLSPSGSQLQALFDSFSILPGKVSGRQSAPIIKEAQGVGWRVKNGVFESAVTGLRARASEPWRLLVGSTLEQSNDEAEVGISHVDPEVYAVLIAERAPEPALRPQFIAALRANIEGTRGEPWIGKFADKDLEFARITSTGAMAFEYLHGVHIEGDVLVQVLAWYISGDRERASKVVQTGLSAFDFLPPAESRALLAELVKARDTQSAIGPKYGLRDGVYRSFANGWAWTKPPAIWRISVGDKARAFNAASEMQIVEPSRSIYGLVISETASVDPDEFHGAVINSIQGTKSKLAHVDIGGTAARVSTIDAEEKGVPTRFKIATMASDNRALQLMFWGARGDMEKHIAIVDAALQGFRFDRTPMTESTAAEYRDNRFGFAVTLPGAEWHLSDQTPADSGAVQTFVMWRKGINKMFGVAALQVPVADEQWFLDFIEQAVRDHVGAELVSGAAERSESTLGGFPARRLHWSELDVYVMSRDRLVYAFITTSGGPGTKAFRLIEN